MHTCTHLYKCTRTHANIHTYIHSYIHINLYKVITQLKVETYSDESKHFNIVYIKLQVDQTEIELIYWQITKKLKLKAVNDMTDKNDTYYTFKMKQVNRNFSCTSLTN